MLSGLIDPDRAGALMEARDGGLFAERLLDLAQSVAGVDELFACRVVGDVPQTLASGSDLDDASDRAHAYSSRFHRSDPAQDARRAAHPGSGFACRIPADAIVLSPYRKLCFEKPRFAEKICFGWRFREDCLMVTFYHRRSGEHVDMAQLGGLAQLAITGLRQITAAPTDADIVPRIERRLADAHPVLTPRERAVCARSMAGHPARAIAEDLRIAQSSVLTYRQRAYLKLGVSRSADLLAAVMG